MTSENKEATSAEQPVYYCNKCHYLGVDKSHRPPGNFDKKCPAEAVQLASVPHAMLDPSRLRNQQDTQ